MALAKFGKTVTLGAMLVSMNSVIRKLKWVCSV